MYSNLKKNINILILLLPAIIAFLIALVVILKFNWPLSWDIFYHVHNVKLLLEGGFTFWDALTYAPYGRPTFYPPLFHALLAFLSMILRQSPFTVAIFLQPIFMASVVFSFSWVTYKLYNTFTAVIAGFFLMFSTAFIRFMMPLPESMALIFFPLVIYFYYMSLEKTHFKYVIIAGILSGIILLTHSLTALCLILILTFFTLLMKLSGRKLNLYYFWVLLGITALVASIWWLPLILKFGYSVKNTLTIPVNILNFLSIFGNIPLIFTIIGGYFAFKKHRNKDLLILTWLISMLALSEIYILGVNVLSERILTFGIFPAMILAGLGLNYIRSNLSPKYMKLFYVSVIFIICMSVLSGFQSANSLHSVAADQVDIGNWFNDHGDKQKVVITEDYALDPIIASIARQPVIEGGYSEGAIKSLDKNKFIKGNYTKEDIINNKIGYIVLNSNKSPQYFELAYKNQKYEIYVFKNA